MVNIIVGLIKEEREPTHTNIIHVLYMPLFPRLFPVSPSDSPFVFLSLYTSLPLSISPSRSPQPVSQSVSLEDYICDLGHDEHLT